jgi:hypothetical protein
MVIERSADGNQFTTIHSIHCSGAMGTHHSFTDLKPLRGKNFYQVKLIDQSNRATYSAIRSIDFAPPLSIDILNNPVTHHLQLTIHSPAAEAATYTLVDVNGRTFIKRILRLQRGATTISVDVSDLAAGLYYLNLQAGSQQLSKKFFKE